MENEIKEYSNGEITVIWKPHVCIHSANCFKGLTSVFNPRNRPWINIHGADSESIVQQVSRCPSGALSIKELPGAKEEMKTEEPTTEITVFKNGPVMVKGKIKIKHKDGKEERQEEIFLCRCGQSSNKPFCDGTHKKCGFKDE